MTLSDLASLSATVSGIAVTASVIYLALQVHQNTKHARALIHQGRVARIGELAMEAADGDIAAAFLMATGRSATPEDVKRRQFSNFCAAMFYGWQDSFAQYRAGLLDDDIFLQMRTALGRMIALPAVRAEWETSIKVPGTKFALFVEEIIATLPKAVASRPDAPPP